MLNDKKKFKLGRLRIRLNNMRKLINKKKILNVKKNLFIYFNSEILKIK